MVPAAGASSGSPAAPGITARLLAQLAAEVEAAEVLIEAYRCRERRGGVANRDGYASLPGTKPRAPLLQA